MADQLEVGDVVQLKSGGPKMTITTIDKFAGENEKAECVWFDKSNRKDALFQLETLQKVEI